MRHLIRKADVITPNMTELFYLLDKPYKAENTDAELKSLPARNIGARSRYRHYHQRTRTR